MVRGHVLRRRILEKVGKRLPIVVPLLLDVIIFLPRLLLPFFGELETIYANKIGLGVPLLGLVRQVARTVVRSKKARRVMDDEFLGEESEGNTFLKQRSRDRDERLVTLENQANAAE